MTVLLRTCMEGKHITVDLDYALLVWEMMPRLTEVSNRGTCESSTLALRFGDVYNPLSICIAQTRGLFFFLPFIWKTLILFER